MAPLGRSEKQFRGKNLSNSLFPFVGRDVGRKIKDANSSMISMMDGGHIIRVLVSYRFESRDERVIRLDGCADRLAGWISEPAHV